jgi:hypothetical protein
MTGVCMGAAPRPATRLGARATLLALGIGASLALASTAAPAQTIADRVRAAPDGEVRLAFAARPGVCGDGEHGVSIRSLSDAARSDDSGGDWYGNRCVPGPVRVELTVRHHEVTSIRTRVGSVAWAGRRTAPNRSSDSTEGRVTLLGTVPAAAAARYLLSLARDLDGSAAREALMPASLADSVDIAPDLLRLVRDQHVQLPVRKGALFWAGQDNAPIAQLSAIYDEIPGPELKKEAIFVLSQRQERAATDKLFQIVQADTAFRMRKQALFWLAQKDDPRVDQLILGLVTR